MDRAERCVAVFDVLDEYPHGADVVETFEAAVLALHFSPDAVDVFRSPGDRRADTLLVELRLQRRLYPFDEGLTFRPLFLQRRG